MHQHWTHSRLDKPRRDFIRGFPYMLQEEIEGVQLIIVHFALKPEGNGFKPLSFREGDEQILSLFADTPGELVCFGHLHGQRINREYAGRHFLNPGSLGTGAQASASYAVIELRDGKFAIEHCRVPYEREALLARYERFEIPAREFIRRIFFGMAG
jgi:predicted phosphodiesterase